jgi:hypothetical protein
MKNKIKFKLYKNQIYFYSNKIPIITAATIFWNKIKISDNLFLIETKIINKKIQLKIKKMSYKTIFKTTRILKIWKQRVIILEKKII